MEAEQTPHASFSTTIIEKCDTGTILDVAISSFQLDGWNYLMMTINRQHLRLESFHRKSVLLYATK